jgi:hypothetical protein
MSNVIEFPNAQKRSISKFTRVLEECLAANEGLARAFSGEYLTQKPHPKRTPETLCFINKEAEAAHLRWLELHGA